MAGEDDTQRAAAVCDNCGTAHAVRLGPDGEIRPIGTGQGSGCTCGDGTLRIMSDDTAVLEDVEMEES
ncbi:hypothetical protein [Natronorubrum tibetense]|uniref:Uncharacterized protein n=1 Tax=Natronorubrum tibetense GA33 TaxID=1114856 RepID=L9VJ07_9EURY|nr:hypothetical protein [Natronorubrum tibetense]ELY36283.1 hypothetical protein C496_22054 [Natronorubrum tibetense GA33]